MALLERLQAIGPEAKSVTVAAPEIGDGETVTFATRLTVGDVLALPPNFIGLAGFAQSAILFRLLAREKNGAEIQVEDAEFQALDALGLHAIVRRAKLHETVFAQLVKEPEGEGGGEGKSSP